MSFGEFSFKSSRAFGLQIPSKMYETNKNCIQACLYQGNEFSVYPAIPKYSVKKKIEKETQITTKMSALFSEEVCGSH